MVAFDAELATAVFGVFADELARWQRERAHDVGLAAPETGCVLEIQRFRPRAARLRRAFCGHADGARLYPHAHALVPDGVFAARRFHGVLAPHHHLRAIIVPTPSADSAAPVAPKRPASMCWADLLMRGWAIDALKCPHCGGRMRPVAAIRDPDAIAAILGAVHSDKWSVRATSPPDPDQYLGLDAA